MLGFLLVEERNNTYGARAPPYPKTAAFAMVLLEF